MFKRPMKTSQIIKLSFLGLALVAAIGIARAADEVKTITGEAKCAKVDLKTQSTCQTVVQVKEGDKTADYYIADNQIAKDFHHNICGCPQKVTATGKVTKTDGKLELAPDKIEVVK